MSIIPPKYPKKERILVPEGMHQAVLYDVWDLGFQKTTWKGKEKIVPQVMLAFEIDKLIPEGDYAGKRFTISRRFTFSLMEKSTLAKTLEQWLLKKLTPIERDGLDLESLIGKNCLIGISHSTKDGKTYCNVTSITPVIPGLATLIPENPRGKPKWVQDIVEKQESNPRMPTPAEPEEMENDAITPGE